MNGAPASRTVTTLLRRKLISKMILCELSYFFGHAFKFKKLLNMVAQTAESMGVPSMYIHGDGHKWSFRQPFDESNFWKIQVDQGGEAPPLKVTVFGSEEAALSDSHSTSKFTVANFISVDRRGGLYESDATS